jgi:hypothetical protein
MTVFVKFKVFDLGTRDTCTESEFTTFGIHKLKVTTNFIIWFVVFAKYNENNEAKGDEIGGACSTNGGEEERV